MTTNATTAAVAAFKDLPCLVDMIVIAIEVCIIEEFRRGSIQLR